MGVLTRLHGLEPGASVPTMDAVFEMLDEEVLASESDLTGSPPVLAYPDDRLLSILLMEILIGEDEFDLLRGGDHLGGSEEGVETLFVAAERVKAFSEAYAAADPLQIVPVAERLVHAPKPKPEPKGFAKIMAALFGPKPPAPPKVEPETEDENRYVREAFVQVRQFLKSATDQSRPVLITIIV